jgi:twitching motility two-component system response regulator PilH
VSTILVVDDAQTDRELMARVIQASGHHALIAVDGKQAVALAKQYRPSLIFLDVVMPVMDGFAACRQLTKDPETSAIPIVLVTSKSNESDVFWGKKQGAADYVAKPWDPRRIEDLIRRYCV